MVYLFDDFKSQILFRSGTAENCRSCPVLASPLEHISGTRVVCELGDLNKAVISPHTI